MWSPRQLAELAGTSRRAVRYYDEIGLLPKPERGSNGYNRYGVDHLIRLIRIRRLTDLGMSLPQISMIGDADRPPEHLMRDLDAELADQLERIQRARAELWSMLTRSGPVDLPGEVEQQVDGIPSAERALLVVLSRLLSARGLSAYVTMLTPYRASAAVDRFDHLTPDAAPRVRAVTAQRLAEHLGDVQAAYPEQAAIIDRELRRGAPPKQHTVDEAIEQLFNPAQLDVLARLRVLHGRARAEHSRSDAGPRPGARVAV